MASGLAIDGEVFVRDFPTPSGPFPFPRSMRHGVWSCTKSLIGLLMLARLAQKYGEEIVDSRVADLVDVTASHDGWEHV